MYGWDYVELGGLLLIVAIGVLAIIDPVLADSVGNVFFDWVRVVSPF